MIEIEVLGASATAGAPPRGEIEAICERAAASRGVPTGHVAIEFVDAARMAHLNAAHRHVEGPTDVLSFPVDGDDPAARAPIELGDIVICREHAADVREAIVHGMLHLLGMDHETDDGEMLRLQGELLGEAQA